MDGKRKLCTKCGHAKPIGEFRFRCKGRADRHPDCRSCFLAYLRRRRRKQTARELDRWTSEVHKHRDSVKRLDALCKAVMARVGGLDNFVRLFQRRTKAAGRQGRHELAFRYVRTIMEIQMKIDEANRCASRAHIEFAPRAVLEDETSEQLIEVVLAKLGKLEDRSPDEVREVLEDALGLNSVSEGWPVMRSVDANSTGFESPQKTQRRAVEPKRRVADHVA